MNNEIPAAITVAVEYMRKSFGGTDVEITSGFYRSAPMALLGCDIEVKIPGYDMLPVKTFLLYSLAEDIVFNQAQKIADSVVYGLLKPEFKKWQRQLKIEAILKK